MPGPGDHLRLVCISCVADAGSSGRAGDTGDLGKSLGLRASTPPPRSDRGPGSPHGRHQRSGPAHFGGGDLLSRQGPPRPLPRSRRSDSRAGDPGCRRSGRGPTGPGAHASEAGGERVAGRVGPQWLRGAPRALRQHSSCAALRSPESPRRTVAVGLLPHKIPHSCTSGTSKQ